MFGNGPRRKRHVNDARERCQIPSQKRDAGSECGQIFEVERARVPDAAVQNRPEKLRHLNERLRLSCESDLVKNLAPALFARALLLTFARTNQALARAFAVDERVLGRVLVSARTASLVFVQRSAVGKSCLAPVAKVGVLPQLRVLRAIIFGLPHGLGSRGRPSFHGWVGFRELVDGRKPLLHVGIGHDSLGCCRDFLAKIGILPKLLRSVRSDSRGNSIRFRKRLQSFLAKIRIVHWVSPRVRFMFPALC